MRRLLALALAFPSAAHALPPAGRAQLLQAAQHDVSAPLWLLRPVGPGRSREEREPRPVPLPAWSAPERDPVLPVTRAMLEVASAVSRQLPKNLAVA